MNKLSGILRTFADQARRNAEKPKPVTRADRWVGLPFALLLVAGLAWWLWDGIASGSFSSDRHGVVTASENPVGFGFWVFGILVLIAIFLAGAVRFIRGNRS